MLDGEHFASSVAYYFQQWRRGRVGWRMSWGEGPEDQAILRQKGERARVEPPTSVLQEELEGARQLARREVLGWSLWGELRSSLSP